MIEELREQLWKAMYLNPVWPSELLENTKDPDYKSVNFKHLEGGLEVELIFIDNEEIVKAIYLFDEKEHIQRIYMIEGNKESIIYDRKIEINKILLKIKEINADETLFDFQIA